MHEKPEGEHQISDNEEHDDAGEQSRLITHGLEPPPNLQCIDTHQQHQRRDCGFGIPFGHGLHFSRSSTDIPAKFLISRFSTQRELSGWAKLPRLRRRNKGGDCGMLEGLKKNWQQLKRGKPGHRFQERAERNQRRGSNQRWLARWLEPIAGVILALAGVVLCFIPGPGLPLIIIGAALLAERSLFIARVLDWIEVKLRKAMAWGKRWLKHAPGRTG
jgi:hypothetical protein